MPETVTIDVWSDVVCPWCYIGKRRLEGALAELAVVPGADPEAARGAAAPSFTVRWRAFELDPSAPAHRAGREAIDMAVHLGAKYGGGRAEGLSMMSRVESIAAESGIALNLGSTKHVNTRSAHRLLAAAWAAGGEEWQSGLAESLFSAHFLEGLDVGDPEVLAGLGRAIGLADPDIEKAVLGGAFESAVAEDIAQARGYGATGVPFTVVDLRFGISGAQPLDVYKATLSRALSA